MQVNLIKGDKTSVDTDYRDALPVNMYGVIRDILDAEGYMLCYPGLTQITTGHGEDRGANYNDRFAKHFRVSGLRLIEVGGGTTELGAIPGTGQAAMPYSFNTQCVIADGRMFLYGFDNASPPVFSFREVTDSDLGTPIDGTWIDGYYFLTDGEYLFHTELTNEDSIASREFATAEFMPDPTKGVGKTQDNKAIAFGRYSVEYFVNVGSDDFAFQRIPTRAQKIGIVATHAKCEAGGNYYFTGGRKKESLGVHLLGIGRTEKVSSREVDKILAKYSEPELSGMRMESRAEDDVTFILVHLPDEVLCFNETVAKKFGVGVAWTILKTDVAGDKPYRGINGVFDSNRGQWIYGDKENSNIGFLDNTVFTHYGEMVEWLLYSPLINMNKESINEIEIDTIPGHTASADAKVAISLTYDGLIYSKEWFEMYGDPLDYGKRFIIRRLGYVPDFVGFKFRGATTSRMALSGLKINDNT